MMMVDRYTRNPTGQDALVPSGAKVSLPGMPSVAWVKEGQVDLDGLAYADKAKKGIADRGFYILTAEDSADL